MTSCDLVSERCLTSWTTYNVHVYVALVHALNLQCGITVLGCRFDTPVRNLQS